MFRSRSTRSGSTGQILVIFVGGLLALIGFTALVVDGGNAMAQQRKGQAASDAAAEAGTTVLAEYLSGGSTPIIVNPACGADAWDQRVCQAVNASAAANGVVVDSATYTDWKGDLLTKVGNGLPTGAQGVQVVSDLAFGTYFARAIGINSFTATTQGTAVTGVVTSLAGGLFPMTVPKVIDTCDGSGKLTPGVGDWSFYGVTQMNTGNESIVPICKNQNADLGGGSAGSVGWLDLSTAIGATTSGTCPTQFVNAITNPCVTSITFPTWIKTFPGGVGKGGPTVEDALNGLHDSVVNVPLFDGTCKVQPSGTSLQDCPAGQIGTGTNTWYHVPSYFSFYLDYFYINGNDKQQCDASPGQPFVSGNGSNGCFKGWWTVAIPGPGTVGLGSVTPSTANRLGIQLIK
jgi:hypothetical protein